MARAIILCYHKVGPVAEEGRRLNIEPTRLDSHIRFFARRHVPVRLPRELASPWPSLCVSYTFDDAYVSAVTHGAEVLERNGVRGAFYAVSDLVGKTSAWDGELARPLANWDTLSDLDRRGHEIGNHTSTHPRLGDLTEADQITEIRSAKDRLLAHKLPSHSFCYPYGSVGSPAVLEPEGYSVGLALNKRIATDVDDNLQLPRIVVAYSDALPMLLYRVFLRPKLR